MNLRALLRLGRIPNVFTAMANVAGGAMLARGTGRLEASDGVLMLASACLFIAAAVLGDVYDRELDAIERPERPIPSGQVGAGAAALFGFGLLGLGVGLAALVSGSAGLVALLVAAAILLRVRWLASTPLAPLAMGACRFGYVALGFAAAPWPDDWRWVAPAAMGFYACVIAYLARDQAGGGIERTRAGAQMMLVVLAAYLAVVGTGSPAASFRGFLDVAPFLAVLVARGLELFVPLTRGAQPAVVRRAIGGGILLMPVVDGASVAAAGFPVAGLAVALFCLPAMALSRWSDRV